MTNAAENDRASVREPSVIGLIHDPDGPPRGRRDDLANLVRELAVYEKLEEHAKATPDDFRRHLFGPRPAAEAAVAEVDGQAGRLRALVHDVLDVPRPAGALPRRPLREAGVPRPGDRQGAAGRCGRLAVERGCGRLEWSVLNWNAPAIGFYRVAGRAADGRVDGLPDRRRAAPPAGGDGGRAGERSGGLDREELRSMSRFFRPHIARMAGYVPGEQPRDGGFIKLNTNENPYPPSPRVKAALVEAVDDRLRLYPDPLVDRVLPGRRRAARRSSPRWSWRATARTTC